MVLHTSMYIRRHAEMCGHPTLRVSVCNPAFPTGSWRAPSGRSSPRRAHTAHSPTPCTIPTCTPLCAPSHPRIATPDHAHTAVARTSHAHPHRGSVHQPAPNCACNRRSDSPCRGAPLRTPCNVTAPNPPTFRSCHTPTHPFHGYTTAPFTVANALHALATGWVARHCGFSGWSNIARSPTSGSGAPTRTPLHPEPTV